MDTVMTIGVDIAKSVFQVHGVDASGEVVIRRQLKRRYVSSFFQKLPPCMVGIEACATAHHWSRELSALGHEVRLMPPAYVKPYVKRHKNDAADAEAICEAVIPHLRDAGGGSIINLSSIYGLVGGPDLPPYYASKGAVRLMTKTDALLYAPDKIRVNSIHPGYIWTPMVENLLRGVGDLETGHKTVDALHPLGHMGEADDIAWGAVYLASDEAKFVTGAELIIDGGYTAR
jgi:hypothetical protein